MYSSGDTLSLGLNISLVKIPVGHNIWLKKHIWDKSLRWKHQNSLTRHLEDCKNAKVRKNMSIGCMGEELLWSSLGEFLYFEVFFGICMHYT